MTEKEQFKQWLDREKIKYDETPNSIIVERGYIGFISEIIFDEDGSFKDIGAFEQMAKNAARYEAWLTEQIGMADRFVACLFVGRARYEKREAATLPAARVLARELEAKQPHDAFRRKALIYAVTKGDQRSVLVE